MSIDSLLRLIPPPEDPAEAALSGQWAPVEAQLGLTLPADYKAYIQRYGTGCFGDFLWPFNPISKNKNLNLFDQIRIRLKEAVEDAARVGAASLYPPFNHYPQPGGLLPWGCTDNGDTLFWLTSLESGSWPIVIYECRAPEYDRFDGDMTEFIADVMFGRYHCPIFPENFSDVQTTFRSVTRQGQHENE